MLSNPTVRRIRLNRWSPGLNPVPCIWVTDEKGKALNNGVLADVAPTILQIMGIAQPAEMTGKSLIK